LEQVEGVGFRGSGLEFRVVLYTCVHLACPLYTCVYLNCPLGGTGESKSVPGLRI